MLTYRSKGVHTNRDKTSKMTVPGKKKPSFKTRMGAAAKAAMSAQSDMAAMEQADAAATAEFRQTAAQMAQDAAMKRQSTPGKAQAIIKAKRV